MPMAVGRRPSSPRTGLVDRPWHAARHGRWATVDARIGADFLAGTGAIIDSQTAVGDYPLMAATTRTLDIPSDVDAYLARLSAELE